MYPSRFRYEAPRSLGEAISLLTEGGDEAKVMAGGQSLVPLMKLRFASPELIVDINNIGGLDYHRADADGTLRIGALCRHADLELERRVGDFATVGVAVALETSGGTVKRAGIALTGVGGSTIAVTAAADALAGKALTPEGIEQAAELAAQAARPRTDHRGSAEYKRHMVRTFVVRLLSRDLEPAERAA